MPGDTRRARETSARTAVTGSDGFMDDAWGTWGKKFCTYAQESTAGKNREEMSSWQDMTGKFPCRSWGTGRERVRKTGRTGVFGGVLLTFPGVAAVLACTEECRSSSRKSCGSVCSDVPSSPASGGEIHHLPVEPGPALMGKISFPGPAACPVTHDVCPPGQEKECAHASCTGSRRFQGGNPLENSPCRTAKKSKGEVIFHSPKMGRSDG